MKTEIAFAASFSLPTAAPIGLFRRVSRYSSKKKKKKKNQSG
jgi:hypothetical protein